MKLNTSTEDASSRQRKDTSSTDKKVQITESDKATETAESYEVNYDTDKPVDPVTGKPPIKSEKWTGTNKELDHNRQEDIEKKENLVSTESMFTKKQENIHLEGDKQKDESTIFKQIGWAGAGIALLIISCIIAWLVYKRKKKKDK
ncbi:hypothetical protein DXB58_12480 [Bacteroides sp. OM05-10AA]|jgi:hypothetical protein|nr:hypothetical protein DXB58_12480 [Bacteroides sp. OM05-10AA]RGQ65820.1 hypothetical protein DWY87_11950 [Bacteroides sp. AF27-33]